MSIISSATLRITENVAKDSVFYGGLTHTRTIIDENKMDKFEANCPNSGIEVWFEYCHRGLGRYPKKYEISLNKYAFDYIIGGTFRRIVNDGDYAYELLVRANEDNDIDLDKGVFVCIYDLGDDGKFIDKIKIEGVNSFNEPEDEDKPIDKIKTEGVKLIYYLEDGLKCCDKI